MKPVSNRTFSAWLKEVRPAMARFDEHLPSPANEYTVHATYPRPGEVELRGFDDDAQALQVEVTEGAVVLLSDIRIELTENRG